MEIVNLLEFCDLVSGIYGDDIFLMNDGTWKCIRGSYVTYVE